MRRQALRAGIFLCGVMLLVSACGGRPEGAGDNQENRTGASEREAMGRYVETFYEMPEEINRNGGVSWLDDESLAVISFQEGLYRSTDGGQSWQQEETNWFPMLQGVYCLSAVMGPDGTVAASCSGEMPKQARAVYGQELPEDWEGNYCVFGMPDGTVKIVDFGFSQEDGSCIETFVFKDDGRLFAEDMQGKVYEVDAEKESVKELFMAERSVGYMDFSGDILLAVGHDRLYRYDLESGVLLPQEEAVDAWIRQAVLDGTVAWTGGGYPVVVLSGIKEEEDVIYLVSVNGMYRHVPGGSVMEQVIDGALSAFGDENVRLYQVKALPDQEFLAVFNPSVGLVHYTWDETLPSMPDQEIRIYSLTENQSVRQAMTDYKRQHADIYVRYEVGILGDGGITAEDAIRKLNTQVLAGEGPDILILDGLPMETYMEKGMLQDIRQVLTSVEGELFSNVTDGFTDSDGAVYAMPMCIQVPLLAGERDVVGQMEDLAGIADQAEILRDQYPQGGIFGIHDPETILRLFGMVSSPAWTREDGQIDEDAVAEFLRQVKRIYDAEEAGAMPEQVSRLSAEAEEIASYGGDPVQNRMEVCSNVLDIIRGYAMAAAGRADGIQLCLDSVTSVLRLDEGLDYRIFNGQASDVFFPVSMVGISSRTGQQAKAEEFVRMILGAQTQEHIYGGYPVNRTACEARFDVFEENSNNGSMMLLAADGTEQELFLYWPDQAERERFIRYMESLKTPVLGSTHLCELVYETGEKVLEGGLSAEDGAAEIAKKASIYLSE